MNHNTSEASWYVEVSVVVRLGGGVEVIIMVESNINKGVSFHITLLQSIANYSTHFVELVFNLSTHLLIQIVIFINDEL